MFTSTPFELRLGQGIYKLASLVEECVEDGDSFAELCLDDDAAKLAVPTKSSVLHDYINTMIWVVLGRRFRKEGDVLDEDAPMYWADLAASYGIEMDDFENFCRASDLDECNEFYAWFESQIEAFSSLWGCMTHEVFHLLFSNRRFLVTFNEQLAGYLQRSSHVYMTLPLTNRNRLRRPGRLPTWLRHAVFFREQGCCAICLKNLSGLLKTGAKIHIDHIVPLAEYGTNDPANFQLLCAPCNLKKGPGPAETSYYYSPWWR